MAERLQPIFEVRLGTKHFVTGHYRSYNSEGEQQLPDRMIIAKDLGVDGCYILYFDESGAETNDTFHESIDAAMKHAEVAYSVQCADWLPVVN